MKTEFSKLPREEVEARITMMLVGELDADEARELMEFVAGDAELMRVNDELKATIGMVREATAIEGTEKISEGKREALLASFKVAAITAPQRERAPARTWMALAAMVAFLLWVTALMFPALSKARRTAQHAMGHDSEVAPLMGGRNNVRTAEAPIEGAMLQKSAEALAVKDMAARGETLGRQLTHEELTVRHDSAPTAGVKIELPAGGAGEEAVRRDVSVIERRMETRQEEARGFAGAQLPARTESEGAQLGFGMNATAGKDLQAGDEQNRFVGRYAYTVPEAKNGTGLNLLADSDVKTTDLEPLTGLPVDSLSAASNERGLIDPLTGLPAEAPATKGKVVAQNGVDVSGQGGAAGGGAMANNMYYMSNPELMKRYFPQMYEMMQRGRAVGGGAGMGMPGMPAGPSSLDKETAAANQPAPSAPAMRMPPPMAMGGNYQDRYRMPTPTPVPFARPPARAEQRVMLGAELKLNDENAQKPAQSAQNSAVLTPDGANAGKSDPQWVGVLEAPALKASESIATAGSPAREKAAKELATLRQLRDSVQRRIVQESADAAAVKDGGAPDSRGVEILDKAEVGEDKHSLVGRFFGRGQERTARVAVNPESRDITPLMSGQQAATYDPYFVQSEMEKVKSQPVLGEVVDQLKLDQKWSEAAGHRLTRDQAVEQLRRSLTVKQEKNSGLLEIRAHGEKGAEAAQLANTVAEVYQKQGLSNRAAGSQRGIQALAKQLEEQEKLIAQKEVELQRLGEAEGIKADLTDIAVPKKPAPGAVTPQPEVLTAENAFSTFSLNVSDVSFKLAAASLEKGLMPDAATVRSEEFINAFDYRDAAPQGAPVGFVWERARYPFAQDRDLVRFSVKTAASGRAANTPMNIVLLIDSSGSMERSDRVRILQECMRTLAAQLKANDVVSVVSFARTPRLWVDGLPGTMAAELPTRVGSLNPEGGTNLEEALKVAYETARKHFSADGVNRVVLLTDGAANLGDVEPESLKKKVEAERKRGIALDCFGIGWEGLNDELLESLSRNGDGRYGFVNSTEAAGSEFAGQLAGALKVAASDVKVQVEWNPKRVTAYRQIGYAKHQLTKEQFRDNTVDAAEIGAAEAGNALYTVQVNATGEGPLGMVRVRFKIPGTNDYREHAWALDYEGAAKSLENSSYPLRLAGTASAFSEWLVTSPYASEVTTDKLLSILSGVPEHLAPDPRPKKLEWMIRQAKSVAGR